MGEDKKRGLGGDKGKIESTARQHFKRRQTQDRH
ncbi:Uncharacterised protein [uncultured archaeon]|nr:Uncharacterised protein [uncultured archaeon]